MHDYIAWLNGASVARGPLRYVEAKARAIHATERWQARNPGETVLKITRGEHQAFVKAVVLRAPHNPQSFAAYLLATVESGVPR